MDWHVNPFATGHVTHEDCDACHVRINPAKECRITKFIQEAMIPVRKLAHLPAFDSSLLHTP